MRWDEMNRFMDPYRDVGDQLGTYFSNLDLSLGSGGANHDIKVANFMYKEVPHPTPDQKGLVSLKVGNTTHYYEPILVDY